MIGFERASAGYGSRAALREVTAAFAPGAVTGIVGPNGAGKTTLLRTALGLLPLQSGAIAVQGRALATWSREALARTIAYLPQGGEAHWPVLARELVTLGRLPHRDRDARAIDAALVRADAAAFAARRTDELSAGERARVLLARALATEAPILLADEPAAWLDPAHQLRLMALLREEAARGTTVAVTLHDLSLASRHCDAILVLDAGRVAATDLGDETLASVFGIEALRSDGALMPWRLV
jgi:iron complex transport system ATP-binding protein